MVISCGQLFKENIYYGFLICYSYTQSYHHVYSSVLTQQVLTAKGLLHLLAVPSINAHHIEGGI